MDGSDLVDRLLDLGVIDGVESEIRLWLTHEDKTAILDAVEKHGRYALENVTKDGTILYSRELRQTVGHDSEFLRQVFLTAEKPRRASALKYGGPSKILLVWADHKFPESQIPVIDTYSPFADRARYLSAGLATASGDAVYGWQFVATMQMRTPLRVLEQHGRIERCDCSKLPQIIREQWEGIWSVKTRPWREFGIDIDEMKSTMASEIGYIDAEGGDLLKFLIMVKRIAKCDAGHSEKSELMASVANLYGSGGHSFEELMKRWRGPSVVLGINA